LQALFKEERKEERKEEEEEEEEEEGATPHHIISPLCLWKREEKEKERPVESC